MASYGQAANHLVNGFMHGYEFMDRIEERKRRRAREDKQEARQDEQYAYQKAIQAPVSQVLDERDAQREHQNWQRETERSNQQYAIETRPTVAQKQQVNQLAIDTAKARLGAAKSSQELGQFQLKNAQKNARKTEQKQVANIIWGKLSQGLPLSEQEQAFVMEPPEGAESLSPLFYADPQVAQAIQTAQRFLKTGDVPAAEGVQALNVLLRPELAKAIGKPARNGGKVEKLQITGYTLDGNGDVNLDVQVFDSNGKSYQRKITQNRSSDPNDPVKSIATEDLLKHLTGVTMLGQAWQSLGKNQAYARQLATGYSKPKPQAFGINTPFGRASAKDLKEMVPQQPVLNERGEPALDMEGRPLTRPAMSVNSYALMNDQRTSGAFSALYSAMQKANPKVTYDEVAMEFQRQMSAGVQQ